MPNQRYENHTTRQSQIQKLKHLISLKEQKIKAHLATILFSPGVSTEVTHQILLDQHSHQPCDMSDKCFIIQYRFDETETCFYIPFPHVDTCIPLLVDGLRNINDLVPELRKALAADILSYGPLYIFTRRPQHLPVCFSSDNLKPTYYISDSKVFGFEILCLASVSAEKVIDRLNAKVDSLRFDLFFGGDEEK